MFGGPVRKSSEWSGLPGSGKKYKRSLGEGDMMMGPDGMGMYMMGRMSKDDLDAGCARRRPPPQRSRARVLACSPARVFFPTAELGSPRPETSVVVQTCFAHLL